MITKRSKTIKKYLLFQNSMTDMQFSELNGSNKDEDQVK